MLLAYSLLGKEFQHITVKTMSMLPWGSIEESMGSGEAKEGFWEVMSLKGGGGVSQAKRRRQIEGTAQVGAWRHKTAGLHMELQAVRYC